MAMMTFISSSAWSLWCPESTFVLIDFPSSKVSGKCVSKALASLPFLIEENLKKIYEEPAIDE